MDRGTVLFAAAVTAVCLAASTAALLLRRKRRRAADETGARKAAFPALRLWRLAVVLWPLCCLGLAALFLRQWSRGMPGRDPAHVVFAVFPLIFFFLGMGLRHGAIKRQTRCTVPAPDARVIALEPRRGSSGIVRVPVYRFTAGEEVVSVPSRSGYRPCPVRAGEAVALFYAPGDRRSIYVPREERAKRRWSLLLCGIGVVFPLLALAAPRLTLWVASLPPWPP